MRQPDERPNWARRRRTHAVRTNSRRSRLGRHTQPARRLSALALRSRCGVNRKRAFEGVVCLWPDGVDVDLAVHFALQGRPVGLPDFDAIGHLPDSPPVPVPP